MTEDPNDPYRYGRPDPLPPLAPYGTVGPQQPAGPPPPSIMRAFGLMLASAALSVVSLVYTILQRHALRAEVVSALNRSNSDVDVDQAYRLALGFSIAFGVVYVVLYTLLAFQVRRGRQWARVVTWVLAGLGVLGLLFQMSSSALTVSRILGTLSGLVDLAIIILLAQRTSSQYIAPNRRR